MPLTVVLAVIAPVPAYTVSPAASVVPSGLIPILVLPILVITFVPGFTPQTIPGPGSPCIFASSA